MHVYSILGVLVVNKVPFAQNKQKKSCQQVEKFFSSAMIDKGGYNRGRTAILREKKAKKSVNSSKKKALFW